MASNLQEKIVANLIFNEDYARKVYPFVKTEYFDAPYSTLVDVASQFFQKYNQLPHKDELKIELKNRRGLTDKQLNDTIKALDALRNEPSDPRWLMETTEKHFKEQSVFNAIVKSAGILENEKGNRGEILTLVQNALSVSFDTNVGHDYFEDYEKRYAEYHKTEDKVSWGIRSLDEITNGGMSKKTLNCIVAPTGCHSKGSLIAMADGSLKKVEDVVVGDRLVGYNGQVRTVLQLCRGRDRMYRITPTHQDSFVVNGEHILTLWYVEKKQMVNMTVNEFMSMSESKRHFHYLMLNDKPIEFERQKEPLPIDPYFLGVYLGDGHCHTCAITTPEPEIKEVIYNVANQYGLRVRIDSKPNCDTLCFSNEKGKRHPLLESFASIGLVFGNRKNVIHCHQKFIPEQYLTSSVENRFQLLAGLIDTDGYLQESQYEYSTKSEQLGKDISRLARSLGFVVTNKPKVVNGTTYRRIKIIGDVDKIPCRVVRKQCKYEFHRNVDQHHRRIREIECLGEDDFYGFRLDGDHLYMDGRYVLHHNSGKSAIMCSIASNVLRQGLNVLYISLEMSEERVAERIDANLMHTTISNVRNMDEETYVKKLDTLKSKTRGKLIIKEYPTSSASVLHFKALLEELKTKRNFVPDLVVVDYLNIASSSRVRIGQTNSYGFIKAISEELRGLAVEYNVAMLTATQTNRSGFNNSDIDMTDVSESIGMTFVMDFQFALIRTEQMDEQNQVMIKQLKNRYGDLTKRREIYLGFNRDEMRFYDADTMSSNMKETFGNMTPISANRTDKQKPTNDFNKFTF